MQGKPTKAANCGTCQICGRVQKLPRDVMAKHGYTSRWGFFQGTCSGSDNQPFEKSKEMIDAAIRAASERRDTLLSEADQWMAGKQLDGAKAWHHVYHRSHGRYRGGYAWEVVDVVTKEHNYDHGTFYTYTFQNSEGSQRLENYDNAKSPDDFRVSLNCKYASHLKQLATELNTYVEWQLSRIANWKPTDLLPLGECQ